MISVTDAAFLLAQALHIGPDTTHYFLSPTAKALLSMLVIDWTDAPHVHVCYVGNKHNEWVHLCWMLSHPTIRTIVNTMLAVSIVVDEPGYTLSINISAWELLHKEDADPKGGSETVADMRSVRRRRTNRGRKRRSGQRFAVLYG